MSENKYQEAKERIKNSPLHSLINDLKENNKNETETTGNTGTDSKSESAA